MKTNKQIRHDARRLFQLCLVNGSLDEVRVRRVVQALLQSKRRVGPAILANFMRWVKLDRSRHSADVESAAVLPTDLQASVVKDVDRLYGPGMSTSFSENQDLIGGMRIRVASDVYDGSVKARLAAVERGFEAPS